MGTGATADFPNLIVEWLPGQGATATNGTWIDITDFVRGVKITRGRQYEIDQFQAGQLDLDMVATTRVFDPENSAGTYFGQLVPMRQVRVTSNWSGTTYSMFRGYITDFGQTIVEDKVFASSWTARDAFVRLEQQKLPSSAWALEVRQDNPTLWFRLGETATLRISDSSDGGNYGLFGGVSQGVQGLVVNDADGAIEVDHSPDARCNIQTTPITGYPFTISAMFKIDGTDPASFHAIFAGFVGPPAATFPRVELSIPNVGYGFGDQTITTTVSDGTNVRATHGATIVTDGDPHHVAVVYSSASSVAIYLDGVAETITSSTTGTGSPTWPTPLYWAIGNYPDIQASLGSFGFGNGLGPSGTIADATKGTLDEFCVWNGVALSSTQVATHATAALTGWDGDYTGSRVSRFLDAISWPASLRSIQTGISVLQAADWSAGSSALSVMQAWADTELSQFFVDRDGNIVWRSRHYPYLNSRAVTSQASFVDGHTNGTLADNILMTRDEALIRNPVQATRAKGVSVAASDTTFVAKYGDRTWSAPGSQDQQDAVVRDRAIWLLGRYKELGTRLASLELFPRRNPATLWPLALGLDIGDRITVKRQPLGLNNVINVDQIIESVEHQGSPMSWTTKFTGSPVDPGVNTFLILDDATYGKLDTGVLAY